MRLVEVWCMGILLLLSLMVSGICFIAPHMTSGPFHPYKLDETISNFRGVWYVFIFMLLLIEIPMCKEYRR